MANHNNNKNFCTIYHAIAGDRDLICFDINVRGGDECAPTINSYKIHYKDYSGVDAHLAKSYRSINH